MGEGLLATALVLEGAENIQYVELIWPDFGYSGPKFQLAYAERWVTLYPRLDLSTSGNQVWVTLKNLKSGP